MKKNLGAPWGWKKASVLMYSVLLTSITLVLAIVVMNNHISLIISAENVEIERKFYRNIKSNIDIFTRNIKDVNSDWWWFVDNISCPGYGIWSSSITMSWSTKREDIKSTLFQSWVTVFCISDYDNKDLEIYFNADYDWFSSAKYDNQTINLSGTENFNGNFSSDNTNIVIPLGSYNIKDWFDDNFNNDNYQSTITSTMSGTFSTPPPLYNKDIVDNATVTSPWVIYHWW